MRSGAVGRSDAISNMSAIVHAPPRSASDTPSQCPHLGPQVMRVTTSACRPSGEKPTGEKLSNAVAPLATRNARHVAESAVASGMALVATGRTRGSPTPSCPSDIRLPARASRDFLRAIVPSPPSWLHQRESSPPSLLDRLAGGVRAGGVEEAHRERDSFMGRVHHVQRLGNGPVHDDVALVEPCAPAGMEGGARGRCREQQRGQASDRVL